jgi:DNA-binding NtrC family response regulator
MNNKRNLSSEDRQFFEAVQQSAFINPFTDARRESDLRALGLATGEWGAALQGLLAELEQRLKKISAPAGLLSPGVFETREDQELVLSGVLFSLFHRHMPEFDALIRCQGEIGDAACEAPFAVALFEKLLQYGLSCTEAEQYIAIFYQMRRAFYFISKGLIGESLCMKQLRKRLWDNIFTHDMRWYVRGLWNRMEDFSTLLLGETGTGKGAVAAALGRSGFIPFLSGKRAFAESFTRAFVAINLSQFSETLIESELFGHRKGAFTGAVERHEGVFARCSPHGAIFLDEIGDASEPIQIKLLQVLQQRTFSPVGCHEVYRFKGRVIAATNRDLGTLRREGNFRDDFFYRLCSDQIEIPTLSLRLQETPSELEALVRHILSRLGGDAQVGTLSAVLEAIEKGVGPAYHWPGNVRELEQAVRCILLTGVYRGDVLQASGEEAWLAAAQRGELSAQQLTAGYCQRLFRRYGSYGEVARRTGLDWRTVKKNINVQYPTRNDQ